MVSWHLIAIRRIKQRRCPDAPDDVVPHDVIRDAAVLALDFPEVVVDFEQKGGRVIGF